MEKYNALLIGCGDMGSQHFESLLQYPKVGDIYVADIAGVEKIKATAAKIKERIKEKLRAEGKAEEEIKPYKVAEDYHEFLDEAKLAVIAAPVGMHREMVEDCFKAGVDVMCEKPIGKTVEDGEAVIEAARESGRCIRIGYILRFNNTYRRVKQYLDGQGKKNIGALQAINTYYYKQEHEAKWGILLGLIEETSPVIDCGSHYVDVFRWFAGSDAKPGGIKAEGEVTEESCPPGKYNVGTVEVAMENGVICTHRVAWEREGNQAAWLNGRAPGFRMELIGTGADIHVSYPVSGKGRLSDIIFVYDKEGRQLSEEEIKGNYKPLDAQLDSLIGFIEGAQSREAMFSHLDDALKSLQMVLEADDIILRNP